MGATFEESAVNLAKSGVNGIASAAGGHLADLVLGLMFPDKTQEAIQQLSSKLDEMQKALTAQMDIGFTVTQAKTDEDHLQTAKTDIDQKYGRFKDDGPEKYYKSFKSRLQTDLFDALERDVEYISTLCVGGGDLNVAKPYLDLVVENMFERKDSDVLTLKQFITKLMAYSANLDSFLKRAQEIMDPPNGSTDAGKQASKRIQPFRTAITHKLSKLYGELDKLLYWMNGYPIIFANGVLDFTPKERSLSDPTPLCLGACGYKLDVHGFKSFFREAYGEVGDGIYVSILRLNKQDWNLYHWYVEDSTIPAVPPAQPAYVFRNRYPGPNLALMRRVNQGHKYTYYGYQGMAVTSYDQYADVQFGTTSSDQSFNWQIIPTAIVSKSGRRAVVIANQFDGVYYPVVGANPQGNHKIEAPERGCNVKNMDKSNVWYWTGHNGDGVLV